jgi:hypothetical protein
MKENKPKVFVNLKKIQIRRMCPKSDGQRRKSSGERIMRRVSAAIFKIVGNVVS